MYLSAVSDGTGVMLVDGRIPRIHLFAQDDGQEGLAFYDRSGVRRASIFLQADGVGALSFYGPHGELQARFPENPTQGPVVMAP